MRPKVKQLVEGRIKRLEAHLANMAKAPSVPRYAKEKLGPADDWLKGELWLLRTVLKDAKKSG